jgi:hypothetical protein
MDIDSVRVDRSEFRVDRLGSDSGDREYWKSKTPQERMEYLELLRQINYGYDPATARLHRVFEVAKLA